MYRFTSIAIFICLLVGQAHGQRSFNVIAYYSAGPELVDSIAPQKLTHIIYSFCHLKGNELVVDSKSDSLTIKKLVELKKINPSLKVILSLGGWGGCRSCSDVFSTEKGRMDFAQSVLQLNQYFKSDGIDLDWEYPTVEGYPGHKYGPADKKNFTSLVSELRKVLGSRYEISFAAGGFDHFLKEAVEWKPVMALVDRVNLMSYDLVNGYSTRTGHHTPLYSGPDQKESTDHAVTYLINLGIPANKIVIGAAFYARVWENVPSHNNGLYQDGKFKTSINYKDFPAQLSQGNGFTYHWDDKILAPFMYNPQKKLFATFDDNRSIKEKVNYVKQKQLDGIMFWELSLDKGKDGLLDEIIKWRTAP